MELEKTKVQEKWLRLSAKQKVEDKNRQRSKLKEEKSEGLKRDYDNLYQKF